MTEYLNRRIFECDDVQKTRLKAYAR